MKKIACIVGTRPQLIKHSLLSEALSQAFVVQTVNTQQHYQYELNEQIIKDLYPENDFYNLFLEQCLPAARLGEMVLKTGIFLNEAKPDAVLVYGDTDSTLAGALAAQKSRLPLIHIEAGERSFNNEMPEEQNRILTDLLSNFLFCASKAALSHLQKEHPSKNIVFTGDIMKDLALKKAGNFAAPLLQEPYLFCTIHRNYNQKNTIKLKALLDVLKGLHSTVIFSMHPATFATIQQEGINEKDYASIQFLPPLSYSQSIHYQKFAMAIITDSGGMQKEAYWLKRPCFTIRTETEWTDTLKGNWNRLVYDDLSLLETLLHDLPDQNEYDANLYGNGNAGALITNELITLLNEARCC